MRRTDLPPIYASYVIGAHGLHFIGRYYWCKGLLLRLHVLFLLSKPQYPAATTMTWSLDASVSSYSVLLRSSLAYFYHGLSYSLPCILPLLLIFSKESRSLGRGTCAFQVTRGRQVEARDRHRMSVPHFIWSLLRKRHVWA